MFQDKWLSLVGPNKEQRSYFHEIRSSEYLKNIRVSAFFMASTFKENCSSQILAIYNLFMEASLTIKIKMITNKATLILEKFRFNNETIIRCHQKLEKPWQPSDADTGGGGVKSLF